MFNESFEGNFTRPGPACPQSQSALGTVFESGYSEDCLSINMEIPQKAFDKNTNSFNKNAKLPVMVFIHGGGFTIGMGKEAYVSSTEYINRDVIFITFNYRLGIWGFLSLKELREEDERAFNFGLQDQTVALRWIIKNVEKFGGDVDKITVFGESAGAMSILWQLSITESDLPSDYSLKNIYSFIIQSPADVPMIPCTESAALFERVLARTVPMCSGRDSLLQCLRELDTETLLDAIPRFPDVRKIFYHTIIPDGASLMPCVGEKIFRQSYRDAFEDGNFNSDPNMIIGTTMVSKNHFNQ